MDHRKSIFMQSKFIFSSSARSIIMS
uniref:Uncharacterized protein n=1 Tax=Lepeophtheirus salmonis TaxID=72036 RepID=A0A0K2U1A2_LEPSM